MTDQLDALDGPRLAAAAEAGIARAAKRVWNFDVDGMPRTKKTSNQGVVVPVKDKSGRPVIGKNGLPKMRAMMFPAADWRDWVKDARIRFPVGYVVMDKKQPILVPDAGPAIAWAPLGSLYNCAATFFLSSRQHGDALGYMQGLADLLEARRIIDNDRQLVTWDGTRCVHSGAVPHVSVTLTLSENPA